MSDLRDQRNKIDVCDEEIIRLIEERLDIVNEVINYKIKNGIEILDSGREEEILNGLDKKVRNPEYLEIIKKIYLNILHLSKEYQGNIKNG